jgi:succinate dehydrogenase / fumarate reductase, cytochrome b subunit
MSETTAIPVQKPHHAACTCRHRYCPRRIHAILGVAVGVFLIAHLAVAVTGLWPAQYERFVHQIHRFSPALPVLELALVFIPLVVQVGYGLRMLVKVGLAYHTDKQSRGGDLRFFLQRLSAIVLLLFIGFHVATMNRWGFHLVYEVTGMDALERYATAGLFHPNGQPFQSTALAIRSYWNPEAVAHPANLLVVDFYAVGIWAACYHLANGLATSAMAWGITVTETAQRRCTLLCLGIGVALMLAGTIAWYAFAFGVQPG